MATNYPPVIQKLIELLDKQRQLDPRGAKTATVVVVRGVTYILFKDGSWWSSSIDGPNKRGPVIYEGHVHNERVFSKAITGFVALSLLTPEEAELARIWQGETQEQRRARKELEESQAAADRGRIQCHKEVAMETTPLDHEKLMADVLLVKRCVMVLGIPDIQQPEIDAIHRLISAAPRIIAAAKVLNDGLEYHEHGGHDMPKRVVRDALIALGVPIEKQE